MTDEKESSDYSHASQSAMGVLITNLGTPDAPTPKAVRRYLSEFLWDTRVVDMPRALWWFILHGVILRIRPRRSARAYRKVWTQDGSPLLAIARRQADALQKILASKYRSPVVVALGMRYGNPSLESALEKLHKAGVKRLLVLPLYPQYSSTTTASTFDVVFDVLKTWRWLPELRTINHYHDDGTYIKVLAASIRESWQTHGPSERLLFSFHGIPKRYLLLGDPYHCECLKTARRVAEELNIPAQRWQVAFQSRFGREEWLQPYTNRTLQEWARSGVKSVDIICPGFSADCLETIEETGMENRQLFMQAGGETYHYIPALNDRPDHIEMLAELVAAHSQGWPETHPDWSETEAFLTAQKAQQRARALGAER